MTNTRNPGAGLAPADAPITYRDAGVDIDAGDEAVERYARLVKATHGPEVLEGVGGFAALFRPDLSGMSDPLLVSCTDGVGTKLAVAIKSGIYHTVGIDLVAMSANDLICCGAKPLFFLDYYATGKLDPKAAAEVVGGIAAGCKTAGMALIGGETAEMPGFYAHGDFDLAGFAVGIVDRSQVRGAARVRLGDAVIGLPSSGLHSNGYSLRKVVFDVAGLTHDAIFPGTQETVAQVLLEPTVIYTAATAALTTRLGEAFHAAAHITGGGLPGNLPRVLPEGVGVRLDPASWNIPLVMRFIEETARTPRRDMWRTFNMGIGLAVVVDAAAASAAVAVLQETGFDARIIGETVECASNDEFARVGGLGVSV